MGVDPQFIATARGFVGSVNSSLVATTLVTAGVGETIRLENLTIFNNHTAAVTVQVIKYNGADNIVYAKSVAAGEHVNVLKERYGSDAEKQFMILNENETLKFQTSTTVAGSVVAEANGGIY